MRKKVLFIIACFSVMLTYGCGGSSSSSTEQTGNNNQAILGPISGAEITAYRLNDLTKPVEGPITSGNSVDKLEEAGTFSLSLKGIPDNELILVESSGGNDIDFDDDGIIDLEPTPVYGDLFAIAKASQWRNGGLRISIITDTAWRFSEEFNYDETLLAERLSSIASNSLLSNDLNNDGTIDSNDLLEYHPQTDADSLSFDLRNIESLVRDGSSRTEIETALTTIVGEYPWVQHMDLNCPACGYGFNSRHHIYLDYSDTFRAKCPACGYEFQFSSAPPPIDN